MEKDRIEYQPTYVEELAWLDALSKKVTANMLDGSDDAIEAFYDIILDEASLTVMRKHYSFEGENWQDGEDELNKSMANLAKVLSGGDIKKTDGALKPIAVAKKFGHQLADLYDRMRTDILFKSVKEWGGQLRQLDAYFFGLDKDSPYSIRERLFMLFSMLRTFHFDIVVNMFDSEELRERVDSKRGQDGEVS